MSPTRRLGTELEAHTLALAKDEQKRDAWAARYVRLAATLEAERKRHHALLRALRVRGQWFAEESAPFVVCRIPRAFFDAIPDLDAGDGTAPVSRGTIQVIEGVAGMRWRKLTPEQEEAVQQAVARGASKAYLARAYDVTTRTIYRVLERVPRERVVLEAFGCRATFVRGDDGEPVRMTSWVPIE